MSNKKFLSKLLTSASVLAVSLGATNVYAAAVRTLTANNAEATSGVNLNHIANAQTPFANGSTLKFDNVGFLNYKHDNNAANINEVQIAGNATFNLNATHTGGAGVSIGSIKKVDPATGDLALTLDNGAGVPIIFNGADYSALKSVLFKSNADKLTINKDVQITIAATIDANVAGNGEIIADSNVIFENTIGATNAVGKLTVSADKSATLEKSATINDLVLANGASLVVMGDNLTLTSDKLDGVGANNGTFNFSGKTGKAAIGDIGKTNALEKVIVSGVGTSLDFSVAQAYVAKTTTVKDDSEIKFTSANALNLVSNFVTETNNTGKITLTSQDRTLTGSIGAADKIFKEINLGSDHTILTGKDDSSINAENLTTAKTGQGKFKIQNKNFTLNANVGSDTLKFNQLEISLAANEVAKLGEDKSYYFNNAVGVLFTNASGVLELNKGSKIYGTVGTGLANSGILSVKGDSLISGGVIANAANVIDKIRFDEVATLTLDKNLTKTTNGVEFVKDGTLDLTQNADYTMDKAILITVGDENGVGSIKINAADSAKKLTFAQIGNVAETNNALKLLEAKNGAPIHLTDSASIVKLDIGSENPTIFLAKNAAFEYLIRDFAHDDAKGNISLENNTTLKTGTVISSEDKRLNSIDIVDKTLTLEDGVDLYLAYGVKNNNGVGKIDFKGASVVAAKLGTDYNLEEIKLSGKDKHVNFEDVIKTNKLTLGEGASASLQKDFTALDIDLGNNSSIVVKNSITSATIDAVNAGNGTLVFENSIALTADGKKVTAAIGSVNKLDMIEIAGDDVTFDHAEFKTNKLKFSASEPVTIELTNIAANELQNTTITTTKAKNGNIKLSKGVDQQFDLAIGTKELPIGNFVISGDDTLNFTNNVYAGALSSKDKEGTVTINAVNNNFHTLGEEGSELKHVDVNVDANLANVYSQTIALAAGKTANFSGTISSSNGITLNANSIANFSGADLVLKSNLNGIAKDIGVINFKDNIAITKELGSTFRPNEINFNFGDIDKVASLSKDLHSKNITITKATVEAIENATLETDSLIVTDGQLKLLDKSVTLNGTTELIGNSALGITLTENTNGKLIIDGATAKLDLSRLNHLTLNIIDKMPSGKENSYEIFTAANGATVDIFDKDKVNIENLGGEKRNFTTYSFAANKITRSSDARKAMERIFADNPDLLKYSLLLTADDVKGAAAEYKNQIDVMDGDAKIIETVGRMAKQNIAQARSVQFDSLRSTNSALGNRVGIISNHVMAPASGDDKAVYGIWINPFFSTTNGSKKNDSAGFNARSVGATIGVDTQVNEDLALGVAITYAKSDIKFKDYDKENDKTNLNSYIFSVYGNQMLTHSWSVMGHASYSTSNVKNSAKRLTNTGYVTADGKYDNSAYEIELMSAYNHKTQNVLISPMFGAALSRINDVNYVETGAGAQNLNISMKGSNKFELIAGVKAQLASYDMNEMSFVPEVHGFIRHDFANDNGTVSSKLSGMSTQMEAKKSKAAKTTYNLGLGFNSLASNYEFGIGYDAYINSKAVTHQGSLKVKVNF